MTQAQAGTKKDWRRPIVFEGIELPVTAMGIDHLGMYDNLPGLSEAASEFLWRFTVCVGRPQTSDSEIIVRYCSETLMLVEKHRDRLVLSVPKHWDGGFDPAIIDDWVVALKTMLDIAVRRSRCTWEAPLRPDEPNFGRPAAEVEAEMFAKMQACFDKTRRKPWWKFW
jgi:hypothetical protein